MLEWRDYVDLSKIKVKNYDRSGELAQFQYSRLEEGRYFVYKTGARWMNGRHGDLYETEKRVGKQWPYIFDAKRKKILSFLLEANLYVRASFSSFDGIGGDTTKPYVHSLVMKAFYPKLFIDVEDPSKMITNHKGPTWDYRLSKLSVITSSENNLLKNRVNNDKDLQTERAMEVRRTGFSQGGVVGGFRSPFYNVSYDENYTERELENIKKFIN